MAERIQRRRTAGWRLPDGAVIVDRTSRWGNPFRIGKLIRDPGYWERPAVPYDGNLTPGEYEGATLTFGALRYSYVIRAVRDRVDAVDLFRAYVAYRDDVWVPAMIRRELGGRDLACTCPVDGMPCHADVLLTLANPTTPNGDTTP